MARREPTNRASKEPAVIADADFGDSAKSEPVSATQSDDEMDMVRRATEVLGINHVGRWMRNRIPSLGTQTPYALLQTEEGRRQVKRGASQNRARRLLMNTAFLNGRLAFQSSRYPVTNSEGARLTGGRWNEEETPVIYASETTVLAAIEIIVHQK